MLDKLRERFDEWKGRTWKPVSVLGLAGCLLLFLMMGWPAGKTPLGTSNVMHIIVTIPHEGGHMVMNGLVRVLGNFGLHPEFDPLATKGFDAFLMFLIVAAGTGGQLIVLLVPAAMFLWRKSTTPLVFFIFSVLASFPGIGIYMMDCRVRTLDYVSPGGTDYEGIQQFGQDWTMIFRYLAIPMGFGEKLGKLVYLLGWLGMPATGLALGWLYYRMNYQQAGGEESGTVAGGPTTERSAALRGFESLLLVLKDQAARGDMAVFLRRKGYAVMEAASLAEALTKLGKRPAALIVARFVEDGVRGFELLEQVRRAIPTMRAVLLLRPSDAEPAYAHPGVAVLHESAEHDDLAAAIRDGLDDLQQQGQHG